jgi:hypothetical protein
VGVFDDDAHVTLATWVKGTEADQRDGDLLLQMDIEGNEYASILATPDEVLTRFRIIAMLTDIGGFVAPRVFELTLLRKDRSEALGFAQAFPHPLDRPCERRTPDLPLPENWRGPG